MCFQGPSFKLSLFLSYNARSHTGYASALIKKFTEWYQIPRLATSGAAKVDSAELFGRFSIRKWIMVTNTTLNL